MFERMRVYYSSRRKATKHTKRLGDEKTYGVMGDSECLVFATKILCRSNTDCRVKGMEGCSQQVLQ